ncbi:hypothetical protein AALA00_13325 [Lachnospiraceae bacterium 46-15]
MDKWEEYGFRTTFLEEFLDTRPMPDEEQWEIVYQCAMDSEETIRCDAAEVLGIRCNEKDEEKLRRMTYDKAGLVNIEAIESLGMGRQEKTLKRLYELMRTGGRMARGYAVGAFFYVWVNRYGYTESSVKKCWRKMEKLYKKEKAVWVLDFYEKVRYLCGYEKGLMGLKNAMCKEPEDSHICDSQSMAFSQIEDIRTVFNEAGINQILIRALESMEDSCKINKDIKKLLEKKELPRVLLVSKENAGLSQMMEYLSYKMKDEIWVRSAGINPAEEIMDEVREKLGEKEKMKRYYYPKKIRSVWIYDFIVPLGIRLKPEDYPFQRIVPLFEDVDEKTLDVARAEKMLKGLREHIYKEMGR